MTPFDGATAIHDLFGTSLSGLFWSWVVLGIVLVSCLLIALIGGRAVSQNLEEEYGLWPDGQQEREPTPRDSDHTPFLMAGLPIDPVTLSGSAAKGFGHSRKASVIPITNGRRACQ